MRTRTLAHAVPYDSKNEQKADQNSIDANMQRHHPVRRRSSSSGFAAFVFSNITSIAVSGRHGVRHRRGAVCCVPRRHVDSGSHEPDSVCFLSGWQFLRKRPVFHLSTGPLCSISGRPVALYTRTPWYLHRRGWQHESNSVSAGHIYRQISVVDV